MWHGEHRPLSRGDNGACARGMHAHMRMPLRICMQVVTVPHTYACMQVITVLSKRGDNGIAPLTPSSLLQMSGRAGYAWPSSLLET